MEFKELEEGLKALKGTDFLECEAIERSRDNLTPIISMSAGFQIRIAAMALKTNPAELEELPLRQLNKILMIVNRFLLANLGDEEIRLKKLDEQ